MAMYRLLEAERLRRLRQQLGMPEPTERNAFAEYVARPQAATEPITSEPRASAANPYPPGSPDWLAIEARTPGKSPSFLQQQAAKPGAQFLKQVFGGEGQGIGAAIGSFITPPRRSLEEMAQDPFWAQALMAVSPQLFGGPVAMGAVGGAEVAQLGTKAGQVARAAVGKAGVLGKEALATYKAAPEAGAVGKVPKKPLAAGQAEMPAVTQAAKEPWAMTSDAYARRGLRWLPEYPRPSAVDVTRLKGEHKEILRKALSEGKPVPANVLAEYPDLAAAAKPVAKAPAAVVPARGGVPQGGIAPKAAKVTEPVTVVRGGTVAEMETQMAAARKAQAVAPKAAAPVTPSAAEQQADELYRYLTEQDFPSTEAVPAIERDAMARLLAQQRAQRLGQTPVQPSAVVVPPSAARPVGPSVSNAPQAAPKARIPNLQAGLRAEPLGPPRKPPGPTPFAAVPGELPSGRKPGGIGRQKPTITPEPLLKAEAALTPQGKMFGQRISEGADSIVRGLFAQNAGLRDLPESSIGHPFSLAKVIPASSIKGGTVVTERYAPVLETVADNLKDLATYKMLQRDKDLLSGPKRIQNLPGGLTGIGDVLNAEKQLAQKLGPEKFAKVKQASEQLDVLNQQHVVQRLQQEGLLTKEAAQALSTEHLHYLPFQREDFVTGIESRLGIPTASVSSTGLKRMTEQGSVRVLHDPLAGLLAQPVRAEHVIARNKAARALVESLQELEKKTGERLVSFVGPERLAKEANIAGAVKPDLASIENSNVVGTISYFKDGVQYQAQIPAYYARIAKSLDAEVASGFITVMRAVTNPFKASVTAYNPGFPLVNLLRDATSFLFNGGLIPFGPSYMRGFKAVITKNADYIAARDAGTFMSGMVESMDSMSKINRVVGRHNRGAFTLRTPQDLALILPRLARSTGRGIKAFNITIEQAPRTGQFIAAKRAGATSLEAAVKGRDVTVDFAQFGTVMRTVDAIFPFANPAMQGLYITARTIKTHPVRSALIGASFMFPTVLSRVNNMRFETSDKIPDYLYQNNWVVQFGEFTDENDERMPMYFKIPKGPIAGPATFPAEALFNVARSSEDRSAVELLTQGGIGSLKALSPIEPSTGAVAPPFGTAVQMQAGKDFYTGMPIVPRGQEGLPSEQQFDERTSKVAIALGQATKVSPRIIDFALQDYFGGAGQALAWLSDLVLGAVGYSPEPYGQALKVEQAPQKQPARLPVVGRVYGTTGSQLQRRGWEKFDAAVEDTNRQFLAIPGMNSLGVKLGSVGDSIDVTPGRAGGSVELTPDQRAEYQQHMARQVIPYLQRIMPNLSGITDAEQKRKLIMKAMDEAKAAARASFIPILLRQTQQRAVSSSAQPAAPLSVESDAARLQRLREELGMAEPVGAR